MKNKLSYILGFFISFSINSFGTEREDNFRTPANSRTKAITQNYNEKESPSDIIQNAQLTRKQRVEKLLLYYQIDTDLGKKVAADSGIPDKVKLAFYKTYSRYRSFHTGLLKNDTLDMLQFLAEKHFSQFFSQLSFPQSKESFLPIIEEVSREIINAKSSPKLMFLLFVSGWVKYKRDKWDKKTSYQEKYLDKDVISIRHMLYAFLNSWLKHFLSAKSELPVIFSPSKRDHIIDVAIKQDQINNNSQNSDIDSSLVSIVGGVEELMDNVAYEEEFNSRDNLWDYVEKKLHKYEALCLKHRINVQINKIINLVPLIENSSDNSLVEQLERLTAEKNQLSVKFNKLTVKKTALVSQLMEKTKELEALNKQLEESKQSNETLTKKLESEKLSRENFQKELQAYNWKTPFMIGGGIVTGAALMYFIYPSIQK